MQVLSTLAMNTLLSARMTTIEAQIQRLEQQVASGQKADTFAGLGTQATIDIALHNEAQSLETYQTSNQLIIARMKTMDQAMMAMHDAAESVKNEAYALTTTETQRTALIAAATTAFDTIINHLQVSVSGRALFAGTETAASPLKSTIFADIATSITAPANAKAAASDIAAFFGWATFTPDSTTLAVVDTDSITLSVKNADANVVNYVFEFDDNGSVPPTPPIDPNAPAGTVTTFPVPFVAGDTAQQRLAKAFDVIRTAGFTVNANKDGSYEIRHSTLTGATNSVTGLTPTSPSTSDYYQGGSTIQQVAIDKNLKVDYGITGDNPAFRDILQGLATIALTPQPDGVNTTDADYAMVIQNAAAKLSSGVGRLNALISKNGSNQALVESTNLQHEATLTAVQSQINDIEQTDMTTAATQLSLLRTQLEATYSMTAQIGQLSLVNYLK